MIKELINNIQLKIFQDYNWSNVPQDQQQQIIQDTAEILYERVMLRVIESMPAEDRRELADLWEVNKDSPELVDEFIKEKTPQFNALLEQELVSYQKDLSSFMQTITE